MSQKMLLEDVLKSKGLKITKHRSSIFNIIKESTMPLTADDIYFILKEKDISISPSSIYKILDTLTACDIVDKYSSIENNKTLYQMNNASHKHNLICKRCKKSFPLSSCPLLEYNKELEDSMDFEITNHVVEIYGYCKNCKNFK